MKGIELQKKLIIVGLLTLTYIYIFWKNQIPFIFHFTTWNNTLMEGYAVLAVAISMLCLLYSTVLSKLQWVSLAINTPLITLTLYGLSWELIIPILLEFNANQIPRILLLLSLAILYSIIVFKILRIDNGIKALGIILVGSFTIAGKNIYEFTSEFKSDKWVNINNHGDLLIHIENFESYDDNIFINAKPYLFQHNAKSTQALTINLECLEPSISSVTILSKELIYVPIPKEHIVDYSPPFFLNLKIKEKEVLARIEDLSFTYKKNCGT